jgi:hypothetical protein
MRTPRPSRDSITTAAGFEGSREKSHLPAGRAWDAQHIDADSAMSGYRARWRTRTPGSGQSMSTKEDEQGNERVVEIAPPSFLGFLYDETGSSWSDFGENFVTTQTSRP